MFPAAIAIVVSTFELRSRGRALALFSGIAGGLTAVGPIVGGYLIEWTWRAISWINIPLGGARPDKGNAVSVTDYVIDLLLILVMFRQVRPYRPHGHRVLALWHSRPVPFWPCGTQG